MQEERNVVNRDILGSANLISVLQNGRLIRNVAADSILVSSESDLQELTACQPGSVAFTAGGNRAWQKNPAGEWVLAQGSSMQIVRGTGLYLDGHTLVMQESEG